MEKAKVGGGFVKQSQEYSVRVMQVSVSGGKNASKTKQDNFHHSSGWYKHLRVHNYIHSLKIASTLIYFHKLMTTHTESCLVLQRIALNLQNILMITQLVCVFVSFWVKVEVAGARDSSHVSQLALWLQWNELMPSLALSVCLWLSSLFWPHPLPLFFHFSGKWLILLLLASSISARQ